MIFIRNQHQLIKIRLFFYLSMFNHALFPEPLFVANQSLWNENTKIFIANCPEVNSATSKIKNLKPPTKDKTFQFLDIMLVTGDDQFVYAISSEEDQTVSKLYRFQIGKENISTEDSKALYCLPFGAKTAKLIYASTSSKESHEKKSKYLILTANESMNSAKEQIRLNANVKPILKSYATIFEINNNSLPWKPKYAEGIQESMQELIRAKFLHISNNGHAILLAGLDKTEGMQRTGAIRLFFLDSLKLPLTFKTHSKHSISHVLALDQDQMNHADSLYAWDKGGEIWKVDLKNISAATIHKIYDSKILPIENDHSIVVSKNLEQPGIRFYLLGQLAEKKANLYRLDVPLIGKPLLTNVSDTNMFEAIFLRFGRLILVPKNFESAKSIEREGLRSPLSSERGEQAILKNNDLCREESLDSQSRVLQKLTVLDIALKKEKPFPIIWKHCKAESIDFQSRVHSSGMDNIYLFSQIDILWNKKQQEEVMVSLSKNCILEVLTAPVTRDKYTRMLWQRK